MRSSQSGASTTSVLTSATPSASVAAIPRFAAAAKPRLRPSWSTRTPGRSDASAAEPSEDPLSTTTTSAGATRLRRERVQAAGKPTPPVEVRDDDRRGHARRRAGRRRRRRGGRSTRGSASASDTTRCMPSRKRAMSKRRACATQAAGSTASGSNAATVSASAVGVGALVERAGLALDHGLARAALVQRDHRPPGRLRLDRGDPELLGRGDDERPAPRISSATRASVTRPSKRIVGPASRRRRRGSGPSPTTTSGRRRRLNASHRDVDPLVRHQLGEDEVVVADGPPARSARSRRAGGRPSRRGRSSARCAGG